MDSLNARQLSDPLSSTSIDDSPIVREEGIPIETLCRVRLLKAARINVSDASLYAVYAHLVGTEAYYWSQALVRMLERCVFNRSPTHIIDPQRGEVCKRMRCRNLA